MNDVFKTQFEQANPELAKRIRHAIPAAGQPYNFSHLRMGDEGMRYVHSLLDKPEDITFFSIAANDMTDKSVPLLADIIRHAPNMTHLNFGYNKITAKGFAELAESLAEHPCVDELYCASNQLQGSGEAIAKIFRQTKTLRHFSAANNKFNDEDFRAFSPELARNTSLEKLCFMSSLPSGEGAKIFADAAFIQNRNLHHVLMTCENEDAKKAFTSAFLDSRASPLLISVTEYEEGAGEKMRMNYNEMGNARRALHGMKDGTLTGTDLRRIETRYRNVFAEESCDKNGYEKLIARLPAFPPQNEKLADALFQENAEGFAPLDNPRLWKDAKSAKATLDALVLTKELCARTTKKGSTLLEAAAAAMSGEEFVGYLNEKGMKLGAAELLTEDGRPNALLNQMINTHQAGAVLGFSNWVGRSTAGLREVFDAIPEYQQQGQGFHQLTRQLKNQPAVGFGR